MWHFTVLTSKKGKKIHIFESFFLCISSFDFIFFVKNSLKFAKIREIRVRRNLALTISLSFGPTKVQRKC